MDRQMELEMITQLKAFCSDDAAVEKAAEALDKWVSDGLMFRFNSAAWDALGQVPDSHAGMKAKLYTGSPSSELAALFAAAQLRCLGNRCPHVTVDRSIAVRAILAARITTCDECLPQLTKNFGNEPLCDGECDLCLNQGIKTFHRFSVAWNGTVLHGDVCPDCFVLLKQEPPGKHPA